MASINKMEVFNERKNRKVDDIVVIGGDFNIYKVTSTFPLDLENLTENKIKGKMFNLTHFIKNVKKYIELRSTLEPAEWGLATCMNYEKYILDFIKHIYIKFPAGTCSTFNDFLVFFYNISLCFDKSEEPLLINFEKMKRYFNELENTDLYKSIMQSTLGDGDTPQFKKHKSPKKASKKASKSPKKASKSPKKASKSPKKALKSPKRL